MTSPKTGTTINLQRCLDLLKAGDDSGRTQLVEHACERMRKLASKMLSGFPRLRHWTETDDVLQGAMLRLHRALGQVQPKSLKHFYRLATLEIRRELLDLTKHHFGPEGPGQYQHVDIDDRDDDEQRKRKRDKKEEYKEPSSLKEWAEFHVQVKKLPEEEREIMDLLWYDGLTQAQAAEILEVSVRTVKKRWRSARLLLHQALHGK